MQFLRVRIWKGLSWVVGLGLSLEGAVKLSVRAAVNRRFDWGWRIPSHVVSAWPQGSLCGIAHGMVASCPQRE